MEKEKKDGCACACEHEHAHEDEHEHEHKHSHACGCGCGCDHDCEDGEETSPRRLFCLCISAVCLVAGIVAGAFFKIPYLDLALYLISLVLAGAPVYLGAVRGLFHGEVFSEEFLMSLASLGAFAIGEFAEGCAVVLLFEVGEWLQDKALDKSRDSIRAMLELRPDRVFAVRDGEKIEVAPKDVKVGEILAVPAGEKFGFDGVITAGTGEVDLAALTGESLPVAKTVGDEIFAGAVSVDAAFEMRVTAPYNESAVASILELMEHAKEKKSKTESLISRFAKIYTPLVCGFALLLAVLPPLFGFGPFSVWLYRVLCALAVSCPCALVISVPLTFFAGLGAASRGGVIVKGANTLETLAAVDTAAFDKTGTLTHGRFSVVAVSDAGDEEKLKTVVAACERDSTHPIARAAVAAFGSAPEISVTEATAVAGQGVRAVLDGVPCLCGNARLMRENGIDFVENNGVGTVLYAAAGGRFLGSVRFADTVKGDVRTVLAQLSALGVRTQVMLTGDRKATAQTVADEIGIEDYACDLLPADKVAEIEKRAAAGHKILFVGDGINDAPVLASADVGAAMGDVGSAAALEAADAVIVGDSLSSLPPLIRTARKTVRIARENIAFALAVKLLILLICSLVLPNLWLAVFGDVGVCLLCIANALRMRVER
ncbi:MAG: cadmium-translocating P-type ATPase [Clostridia bacterium]|nr:cadmium-translocating P-type ATPase [Clostridia bacterium]